MKAELKEIFLELVRLGIGHTGESGFRFQVSGSIDWVAVKALAEKQGLTAVVLDGIDKCHTNTTDSTEILPLQMKLEWIGEVLQNYEARYAAYEKAIWSLVGWYNQHGFKMMVLKGYACAMDWPVPNHRPCGDIDIWLFGQQREADAALGSWFLLGQATKVERLDEPSDRVERKVNGSWTSQAAKPSARFAIDNSHHHHTVFEWEGFTVDNHYDFLNVHHHRSNVEMEKILKELGSDDSHYVELDGGASTGSVTKVYLPSANLHALFLLRHAMSNFASTGFQLRQLLDWVFFVEKHGKEIDWEWLEGQVEHFGMRRLYDVFNAICVGDLGFDVRLFPQVQFVPSLKERVLNDILSPEFSEKESGGIFSRAWFKYRRWKANAWKHELCFSESLWSAFWSGVRGHLMKPGMI